MSLRRSGGCAACYWIRSSFFSAWAGWPGVARRLLTFFASPKKVSKKRRPLLSATLRFATGTLRCSVQPGSRANSPSAQTSTSPDPSGLALLSEDRRGWGMECKNQYQQPTASSRTAEQPNSRTAEQPNSRTAEQPNSQTAKFNQTSRPINQKRYELNSGLRPPNLHKRHF